MINEEIVELIHTDGNILGTFIEIGAGQPVAHELFNIGGASKTIYKAESPYSKSLQEKKYPSATKHRSVSKEFISAVIDTEMAEGFTDHKHNTYFVTSFQIADKPEMLTHGWIGLRYKGVEKFYHLTLTDHGTERTKLISIIGSIGLRILYCKNDLKQLTELFKKESAMYSCIDIIEGPTSNLFNLKETLSNLESGLEHPITISKEGKLIRLEDLSRQGDLILMKGSFNPVHNHHLEIMKQTEKAYPKAIPCFSISIETYSKGNLDIQNLVRRIEMINKLGYPVIVFRGGYFLRNVSYLRNHRFIKNKIIFPLGSDTVNRLVEVGYKNFKDKIQLKEFYAHFENVEFPYVQRPGVPLDETAKIIPHFKNVGVDESSESSTSIRELFIKEDYETIKKIVPPFIYDDIIIYLSLTLKS